MRTLSLAIFAIVAFALGVAKSDTMSILFGVASAAGAVVSLPSLRLSTFLRLMAELFAAETVLFGLADLLNLVGYWPEDYKDYALPRYLPIATAMFVIVDDGDLSPRRWCGA